MPKYPDISGYSATFSSISSFLDGEARAEFSKGREPFTDSAPQGTQVYCAFTPLNRISFGEEEANSTFDPRPPKEGSSQSFRSIELEGESQLDIAKSKSDSMVTIISGFDTSTGIIESTQVATLKATAIEVQLFLEQLLTLHGKRRPITRTTDNQTPLNDARDWIARRIPSLEALYVLDEESSIVFKPASGSPFTTCNAWLVNDFQKGAIDIFLEQITNLIGVLDNPIPDPTLPTKPVSIDEPGTLALLNQLEKNYNKINNENYIIITRLYDLVKLQTQALNRIHELRSTELKEVRVDSKRALGILGSPENNFWFFKEGVDPENLPETLTSEHIEIYALSTNEFLGRMFRDYFLRIARLEVAMDTKIDILTQNVREIVLALGGHFVSAEEWAQIQADREQ